MDDTNYSKKYHDELATIRELENVGQQVTFDNCYGIPLQQYATKIRSAINYHLTPPENTKFKIICLMDLGSLAVKLVQK